MLQRPAIDTEFHLDKIDSRFQPVFRLALPFLATRKNKLHTFIAYQYALSLLQCEPGVPEIAIPACILHDVGWSAIPEKDQLNAFGPFGKDMSLKRKHEIEGVAIAQRILLTLHCEQRLTDRILEIIDGHDTTPRPKCAEDAIVKDADKLWRFSEIGFLIDIQRFNSEAFPYFKYLEAAVDEWFLTETGREIALDELRLREKEIQHPSLDGLSTRNGRHI